MVSIFVPGPISRQELIEVPLGAIGHVIGEAGSRSSKFSKSQGLRSIHQRGMNRPRNLGHSEYLEPVERLSSLAEGFKIS